MHLSRADAPRTPRRRAAPALGAPRPRPRRAAATGTGSGPTSRRLADGAQAAARARAPGLLVRARRPSSARGAWARAAAAHGLEFLRRPLLGRAPRRLVHHRRRRGRAARSAQGPVRPRVRDLRAGRAPPDHGRRPSRSPRARDPRRWSASGCASPRSGGFFEGASEDWQPVTGPRRQNPHMHLVEALLALHAVAPDAGALARGARARRAARRATGSTPRPARWASTSIRTGGRSAEGAGQHRRARPPLRVGLAARPLRRRSSRTSGRSRVSARLFDFARRFGVDADGGVFDQVDRTGGRSLATKRLWPQTERVKA